MLEIYILNGIVFVNIFADNCNHPTYFHESFLFMCKPNTIRVDTILSEPVKCTVKGTVSPPIHQSVRLTDYLPSLSFSQVGIATHKKRLFSDFFIRQYGDCE